MGMIFDIQRCSYHDGPGIRTTVFFKGCPLRCAWCHNPESFRREPQLRFLAQMCSGCGQCVSVCPEEVHQLENGVHLVDFSRCIGCGRCAAVCPSQALTLIGYETTPEAIMETVLRDRAFYDTSGGGLTVSGGEPTNQPEFLTELLSLAKAQGIHICLETNGYIGKELLPKLIGKVDLFLLDYKITGSDDLYRYTHARGELWDNTLEALQRTGTPVILRLPIIPGINDNRPHFMEAARLGASHSCIQKLEIMPYHAIGADKWKQLGYSYSLDGLPSATQEQAARWQEMLDECLACVCAKISPPGTSTRIARLQ